MIRRKIPWTRQPPQGTKSSSLGGLSEGLEFCHLLGGGLNDAAGRGYNLVADDSTNTTPPTEEGPARYCSSSTSGRLAFGKVPTFASAEALTLVVRVKVAAGESTGGIVSLRGGANDVIDICCGHNGLTVAANQALFIARDDAGSLAYSNGSHSAAINMSDGKFHTLAIKRQGGNWYASADGRAWAAFNLSPTNGQGAISQLTPASSSYFNDLNPAIGTLAGHISFAALWKRRGLSDSEIRSVHANPWQIFAPQTQNIPTYVTAGGAFSPWWAARKSRTIGSGII